MSDTTPPTIGRKIDELLEPFVQDEADLATRLEQMRAEAQRLQDEMAEAERDLAVVRSAKVDALRGAAESDPLLSAAFFGGAAGSDDAVPDDSVLEVIGDTPRPGGESDGHPLLRPGA